MTATLNGNARRRAEYEEKTKDLKFTKDFNPALEAIMRDELATAAQRVMAWIKRMAWGNYCLYAVDEDTGQVATQADLVRDLDLNKTRVSHTIAYLETRGYLYRDGKKLYPIVSPTLGPPQEKLRESATFRLFFSQWKVANSTNFERLEVARSTIKEVMKVALSDYKKWRASQKNGGPILIESKEIKREETSSSAVPSSSEERIEPPAPPKAEEEDPPSDYKTFKGLYPRAHFDEAKAKHTFQKLKKAERQQVIARLALFLDCERWRDEEGRYIPLASNWLNGQWMHDPPPALKKRKSKREEMEAEYARGKEILRQAEEAERAKGVAK